VSWPEILVEKAQEAAKEADIASTRARDFEAMAQDVSHAGAEEKSVMYAVLSVGARIEAAEWSLISAWMVQKVEPASAFADEQFAELIGNLTGRKP